MTEPEVQANARAEQWRFVRRGEARKSLSNENIWMARFWVQNGAVQPYASYLYSLSKFGCIANISATALTSTPSCFNECKGYYWFGNLAQITAAAANHSTLSEC